MLLSWNTTKAEIGAKFNLQIPGLVPIPQHPRRKSKRLTNPPTNLALPALAVMRLKLIKGPSHDAYMIECYDHMMHT
jgi:hypothetical protein